MSFSENFFYLFFHFKENNINGTVIKRILLRLSEGFDMEKLPSQKEKPKDDPY